MKRLIVCLLAAFMLLTGCSPASAPQSDATTQSSDTAVGTTATETTVDTTLDALTAYEKVLLDFYEKHLSPDGQELVIDNEIFGHIEENSFAVADVDGDGNEELVLIFSTAPMAGMCLWVCGYNGKTDSVYQELSIFPNVTFYTDGLIEAGWSHNQGMAGDVLWPYTLMKYDPDARSYLTLAQVDAWDKDLRDTDYDGNPFPDDVDTDGIGAVYLITEIIDKIPSMPKSLSRTDYEVWRSGIMGSAAPMELEYLATTLDNIHAVSPE